MKIQILQTTLLLLTLFSSSVFADHISEPDRSQEHLQCDLECHNNGVCRFITKDPVLLQHRIQSGHMVQECICSMGYRGMSCEVDVEEHPCPITAENTNSDCDCVVADTMSVFAGEQCRKPFTEYGASLQNTVGGHVSFCTNGGKLKGDLLAAQASPGNTTNNYLFQHAGCLCPPEFFGEHCELLNNESFHPSSRHHAAAQSSGSGAFLIAFVVVCIGSLGLLVLIFFRKVRSHRNSNIALSALPQLPPQNELAMRSRYKDGYDYGDDEFADPYNNESFSSDDEEYKDALPEIL